MKIAFPTSGEEGNPPLESRFGRAARFLVYDVELGMYEAVENRPAREAAQGAGIQAAEAVVRSGAEAVVTGHCGPKAFRVLSAASVRIFTTDAATVADALAQYLAGELVEVGSADVEGHWA